MKKAALILVLFICHVTFSQNNINPPQPTGKKYIQPVSQNMDWYQITFDVDLDDNDTLNTALINSIDFNTLENQRLETEDFEVEIEVDGTEIEIILFSYQKCAFNKNGTNSNSITE